MPEAPLSTPKPETAAQRAERLKKAKNPWECADEILAFCRGGYEAVPPEWRSTYFRWWGIYPQGDGAGVLGGKGGVGKETPYFMVRIRIPNGLLFSHQLRTIADLSERYARGTADITVRQNVQLHWVEAENLPTIFKELWRCGLTTMAACGDDTRNITGCPVAGVDADELCDASPLVLRAQSLLVGNPEFYNLPRKYKISITGCRSWCCYPEINDVALTATRARTGEIGFSLRVAGGLSSEPLLAQRLNAFVHWNQVPAVIVGVTKIFRDSDVLREHRERARLKFLFLKHGWTPERFLEELQRVIGFEVDEAEPEELPDNLYRDHIGVHAQKQPGYYYVGASVLRGRITPDQLRGAADLAERHASGELRTTTMQKLLIVNVPATEVDALCQGLEDLRLPVSASPFARGTITCTGSEFCRLAITETKAFARWLIEEMEERMPGFEEHLKLHVTGCPNSCGQHWISDIGLEGKKIKVDGRMVDAYQFSLGGGLGQFASIGRPTSYRCRAEDVPDAIERLLRAYLMHRQTGEPLRGFLQRHNEEQLRGWLSGSIPVECGAPEPAVA